ncbi:MAG: GNAT family N-acetyltransferase [Thermoanaerobaculales bacterium]
MTTTKKGPRLEFHPLASDRWGDLEALFGPRGACGGCWCMSWLLTRRAFDEQKGEGNRRAFRKLVKSGTEPGIVAYADGEPIGWCAIAPRERYVRLERSRTLARVDEEPVWSIVCFFVTKELRRSGVSVALIKAAAEFAAARGAKMVEGYPVEPYAATMPAAFAWTGTAAAFRHAGFTEVARRSRTRPIMRLAVGG